MAKNSIFAQKNNNLPTWNFLPSMSTIRPLQLAKSHFLCFPGLFSPSVYVCVRLRRDSRTCYIYQKMTEPKIPFNQCR